ncbi:MAG TPA: hypothetical protein VM690_07545, partial [Gaiellaceae bacterium]|nr:hypothetical protein [Gaiellaceae bacterium]
MAEKTATWSLNLESNAPAVSKDTAKSLEGLRQQIQGSTEFIKLMSGSLRSLRGASDDVKAAKEQLKAKIDAEKGAVSKATVELLKQGTTYGKLTESAKKTTSATKDLGAGLKEAGGPLADFSGKLGAMKDFLGEGSVLLKGSALAVGVLAAAFVGVTAAIVGSTAALARWLVVSGNELRAMNLAREAAAGSAENAKALGTWVDLLSRKVSTSKDKINELAVSLTRDLSGGFSKVSGQGIVDTFAAVTQAAAAAGDEVGNAIGDIVKRSKLFGRIRINPFELQGKGINFEDVAGALSKNLKIGLKTARLALYQGMVPIDAGAKALRDAVEKRFGAINT